MVGKGMGENLKKIVIGLTFQRPVFIFDIKLTQGRS